MSKPAIEKLARSLADAWRNATTTPLPPLAEAAATREDAYRVQDRLADLLGEPIAGWKVGAAVKAVQILEGHDGPIVGRLFAPRVYTSPANVPAARYDGYKIECEAAFRFVEAVPARAQPYTRYELAPKIAFHPGVEIAGSRYAAEGAPRKAATADAIADNGGGGAYVVSANGIADWAGIDFERLAIDAHLDDGTVLEPIAPELRRDPVDILVETVNDISARGYGFRAGDLLSTGTLTVPRPMRRGRSLTAHFGRHGSVSFRMD